MFDVKMKMEIQNDERSLDSISPSSISSVKKELINNNNNNNFNSTGESLDNESIDMNCGGCGESINERTVLCVGGRSWHSKCLRCCICARSLNDQQSCFLRGMKFYCRHDYL
ncbi:hypothetical protein KQX54_006419 [Cotesia glomerata]|uniref:LIM zinc-binding domain-containing protein n=2 Tax=Cotesia glomerata TaxID=32391 RepID=A0AAV7I356_COTGL|nr:hypothetical protein KQX54_006419 [Cotesia glomerata]